MKSNCNYKVVSCILAAFILAACSQGSENTSAQKPNESQTTNQAASLDKTQLYSEEVVSLDGPRGVIFSYWSRAAVPIDYPEIATLINAKYRNENNDYKKDEILKALQPSIDQEISRYKSFNKFKVETSPYTFRLKEFDYQYKFFPIGGMSDGSLFMFNNAEAYQVKFVNGSKFSKIPIEDKDLVDRINKLNFKFDTHLNIYFTATEDEIGNTVILAKITKIELVDTKGNILSTIQ